MKSSKGSIRKAQQSTSPLALKLKRTKSSKLSQFSPRQHQASSSAFTSTLRTSLPSKPQPKLRKAGREVRCLMEQSRDWRWRRSECIDDAARLRDPRGNELFGSIALHAALAAEVERSCKDSTKGFRAYCVGELSCRRRHGPLKAGSRFLNSLPFLGSELHVRHLQRRELASCFCICAQSWQRWDC